MAGSSRDRRRSVSAESTSRRTRRWAPDGVELLLEPNAHPAAKAYQEAIVADGIPATSFAVEDVAAEAERLQAEGVAFVQPPTEMGPVTTAVLDDTCGNLIQIASMPGQAS